MAFRMLLGGAVAALSVQTAAGCSRADFTDTSTAGCQDPKACTCEEDPSQATCKGFNGRPEFESGIPDARDLPGDSSISVDPDAAEGGPDASDDAADAADD